MEIRGLSINLIREVLRVSIGLRRGLRKSFAKEKEV